MASSLEPTLIRSWQRRGALACALWPLSLLFGAIAAMRRGLYRAGILHTTRLPVPLIVVGNIFIGGTGKTPLAIWLIGALRAAGYQPGLISRGYGARDDAPRSVLPTSPVREVGDEPLLIACRTAAPIMVGRDRVAAAQALLQAHPQVDLIISDDGLQHYALGRDLEIILFDARGAGNGWLLPAGPLREPVSRRRDFTVINGAAAAAGEHAMQLTGQFAGRLGAPEERLPLAQLPSGQVLAAAGIGNPGRFFSMLRAAGLVFEEMPLPDHFAFADNPFAAHPADIILITEKDAVKCRQIPAIANDPRLWVVPVDAQLAPLLAEQIVEKLRGYPPA